MHQCTKLPKYFDNLIIIKVFLCEPLWPCVALYSTSTFDPKLFQFEKCVLYGEGKHHDVRKQLSFLVSGDKLPTCHVWNVIYDRFAYQYRWMLVVMVTYVTHLAVARSRVPATRTWSPGAGPPRPRPCTTNPTDRDPAAKLFL